jgi:hypothetical protein
MDQFLTFSHRRANSLPVRLIGVALMGIGVFMVVKTDYWAGSFIPVGWILLSSKKGVEIDKMSHEFRNYTSYLGYRTGVWHDLDKYPYVTIVKSRKQPKVKYASAYEEQDFKHFFDVCLLSKSHRGRVHIIIGLEEESARQAAFKLADDTGKEVVGYAPPKPKGGRRSLRDSRKRTADE